MSINEEYEAKKLKLINLKPKWFASDIDISIPDGWFDLATDIVNKAKQLKITNESMKIVQIKQKFGGLRFYVEFSPNPLGRNNKQIELASFIASKEKISFFTCKKCGFFTGEGIEKNTILTYAFPLEIDCIKCNKGNK